MEGQQHKRKLFEIEVPLWVSLLMVLIFGAIVAAGLIYFQVKTYNYTINVGEGDQKLQTLEYGPLPELANANYFAQVKSSFVEQKSDFIEADLSEMKVRVYKEGGVVKELPIITKGREG